MNSLVICLVAVIIPSVYFVIITTLDATLNKGEN